MTDADDRFFDEIFVLDANDETVLLEHGRPHRPATAEGLAAFETELYEPLRRARDAETPVDDALPDDALADIDATRSALSRLPRA